MGSFGGLKNAPDFANDHGKTGMAGAFNDIGIVDNSFVKTVKIHVKGSSLANSTENEVCEPFTHPVLVLRAWVDVLTAEVTGATKTVGFGTKNTTDGGDVDGFIAAASVAATGPVLGAGALINTIVPKDDHLVVGIPNAFTEFVGDIYFQYIDLA